MHENRNPKAGCIKLVPAGQGGDRYQLTERGYALILERATIGSSIPEIAEALRVSVPWLRKQITDEQHYDPEAQQAYLEGYSAFRAELRAGQLQLSKVNASMSQWLGKQHLGQREQVDVHIDQTIRVVGALPDYTQTPEDWRRQFAPGAAPKQIETNAEDAEVIGNEDVPVEFADASAVGAEPIQPVAEPELPELPELPAPLPLPVQRPAVDSEGRRPVPNPQYRDLR